MRDPRNIVLLWHSLMLAFPRRSASQNPLAEDHVEKSQDKKARCAAMRAHEQRARARNEEGARAVHEECVRVGAAPRPRMIRGRSIDQRRSLIAIPGGGGRWGWVMRSKKGKKGAAKKIVGGGDFGLSESFA